MANRIPFFSNKHKICVICEGNEEHEYFKRLIFLGVWNNKYAISLVNAGGNGNIPARYQDRYQNGSYELVLVFCDTEKNRMNNMKTLSVKSMNFMVWIMHLMKSLYLGILVLCRLFLNIGRAKF